jgi:hypothetical protein
MDTIKVRAIPVGRGGHVTIVDAEDYEKFAGIKWSVSAHRYAHHYRAGYLHRLIMSAQPGQTIDHINGDGMDNRRCNLRICTQAQNVRNKQVIGISFNKHAKKWTAQIKLNGKKIHLGCFSNPNDAITARRVAEELHFGEFRWREASE